MAKSPFCSIAFCACFAANTWNGQNYPFLSQALFFENGSLYDQLAILDENFRLDPAKLAIAVRTGISLEKDAWLIFLLGPSMVR